MAANTLTGLIQVIYDKLDVVSRELVGFIPAVGRDTKAERAAVGQTIRSPVTPALTASDITPGPYAPDTTGQTIGFADLTITKAKSVPFGFTGEEALSLQGSVIETPWGPINSDLITQSLRTLCNAIETDIAAVAYKNASRAYGTAGATPFGTAGDMSDLAQTLKILQDNGCPLPGAAEVSLVMPTTVSANVRGKQSGLFKVNEAGNDRLLRTGALGEVMGFSLGETAQLSTVTKGTGTSYTSSTAGFAIGTTQIPVITGSGTILAGDVITFAGDTNKYVVTVGVAAPGTITIAGPGLRQALAASAVALTIGNNFTPSVALHRSAVQLVQRLPAAPPGGDAAAERITVQDPKTGLVFEFCVYRQYRQVRYEIGAAWGVASIASRHSALLLG